jgi:hypothetical protein
MHQLGAHRAKPKPLLHYIRGDAEAGRDFLRSPSARFSKFAKRLVLVGRVHGGARDVLVKADLERIVRRVDDAADGFRLLDLLRFT